MFLKQSTAGQVVSFGPFVDPTDGVTLQVGLVSAIDHGTTGIFLSKAGGALTIRHASVTASTYDAYGNYLVTLDATDTNTLGRLRMQFAAAASCVPVWQDFTVLAANVYDSLVGGGDLLDVSTVQLSGGAQSLTDLKDFADTGYDPATHKVAGVVLTDTATTVTGGATSAELAKVPKSDGTATWNSTALASLQSKAQDAITASALATAANLATVAGYLDTEIAAILADTNELQTDWANGGRLDLILDARASQTSVDDVPTNAELTTALGTADDAVLVAIADLPTNAELATALGTADDAVLVVLGLMAGATFDTATDSLEAIRNRGDAAWITAVPPSVGAIADQVWDEALAGHAGAGTTGLALSAATAPSAGSVADAVWDEALAGHAGAGSAGLALSAAGSAGDPWATLVPGAYPAGTAGFAFGSIAVAGSGAITWPYTLTDSVSTLPIADADIWVSTDAAGANVIASGRTSQFGIVTFFMDAGPVFVWRQKSGYDFSPNPEPHTVA